MHGQEGGRKGWTGLTYPGSATLLDGQVKSEGREPVTGVVTSRHNLARLALGTCQESGGGGGKHGKCLDVVSCVRSVDPCQHGASQGRPTTETTTETIEATTTATAATTAEANSQQQVSEDARESSAV